MDRGMESFLLGLVDSLGAAGGNFYRPDFKRKNYSGIYFRCDGGAYIGLRDMVLSFWRHGVQCDGQVQPGTADGDNGFA